MKLERELKYHDGTMDLYQFGIVKEGGTTAHVFIVPGEFFDKHCSHSIEHSLPVYAGAFCKTHPDYDDIFGPLFPTRENIILIRDEVFKLADKKELDALVEHEFGHIFFGYTGEIISEFDEQELLADIFIDDYDAVLSLEKKWALQVYKKCKECSIDFVVDEQTIPSHWFLYCPKCGDWFGDGKLNPFYITNIIRGRCGLRYDPDFKKKCNPILSYEEHRRLSLLIANAKLIKNGIFDGGNSVARS